MLPKRGDVVLVLFPNSDLRTAKRRPALVVQRDELQTGLRQTIVALITSNLARAGHPSRITIPVTTTVAKDCGLRTDSVLMTDNIATVLESEIVQVIGEWKDPSPVDAALRHTLQL